MEFQAPHLLLYSIQGCFDGNQCLSAEMPGRVWSGLPLELQEHVLAKLPTTSLLRFRSVCKPWLNLFNSDRFRQLAPSPGHSPAAAAPVFSYQFVPGASSGQSEPSPHPLASLMGLAAFSSCEVRKVDLSFLPAAVLAGFSKCVAQDGLFVVSECTAAESLTGIFVVNPMTRSWVALNLPTAAFRSRIVTWDLKVCTVKGSSSSFRLVLAFENWIGWNVGIYASASKSWRVTSSLGPNALARNPRFLYSQHGPYRGLQVLTNRGVYVYQTSEDQSVDREYEPDLTAHAITLFCSVAGFAINRYVLNALEFSFYPRDLFLVEHRDTVYFVVGSSGGILTPPAVRIGWFDQHAAVSRWKPLAVFPLGNLSSKWLPRARASLECGEEFMGLGGAVVLGDSIWISVGVSAEWHVVEYRIRVKSWHPVLHGPFPASDYTSTLWSMVNRLVQPRVDFKFE